MKFKDWRQKESATDEEPQQPVGNRFVGRQYYDHIDQLIEEARAEGKFDNLTGSGRPLSLDDDSQAGDNVLTYRIMKNNHVLPPELMRAREAREEQERINQDIARFKNQHMLLLKKRNLSQEAREAQNRRLEQVIERYRSELQKLNSKILTVNLTAPASVHMQTINIEEQVTRLRVACPRLR
jgi:hypothetical protein